MTFPTRKSDDAAKDAAHYAVAPSPHVDALLRILEDQDAETEPLMQSGMDGRTATILKEIEKSGAISVRTENGEIWVDVLDRPRALSVIDTLIRQMRSKGS